MRTAVAGAFLGAGLILVVVWATGQPTEAFGQRSPREIAPQGELIALTAPAGQDCQQITVIDPKQRVMCVYHVELQSGKIKLKSVRNITWDLQMLELNSADPEPREIRSLLERR